jgi:hypothetical protein
MYEQQDALHERDRGLVGTAVRRVRPAHGRHRPWSMPHLPQLVQLVTPSVLYAPEITVSRLAPTAALAGAVAEAWHLTGSMPPISP